VYVETVLVSSPAMAPPLLKPFRALRYDVSTAGPLDRLVAPPYDVISPELMARLVESSPYNVIRLIRPYEYDVAGERLREWSAEGVLVREDRPAVWRIEEEYVGPDGQRRLRRGVVARVRLEPYDRGVVLPHERIFATHTATRLELLRATRTKLSPVLLLHDGPPSPPASGPPDLEARLDDSVTRVWRIADPAAIEAETLAVQGPLVIADGHHRYDAALRFHAEEGTEETAYVLAVLVSASDPGLTIFPTHRLVAGSVPQLNGDLHITPIVGGALEGIERLGTVSRDHPAFVLVRPGDVSLAEVIHPSGDPVERLDVAALDRLDLDVVSFTPSLREAEDAVVTGRAAAAFLVRAPTIAQVEEIARAGRTMPEKSTYFFPKLTSGLLFSPFDE
jgi:uncharacterized protein (DUF1015 family)